MSELVQSKCNLRISQVQKQSVLVIFFDINFIVSYSFVIHFTVTDPKFALAALSSPISNPGLTVLFPIQSLRVPPPTPPRFPAATWN